MNDVEEFLKESNAIEGVYDEDSLQQALYAWDFLSKQKELTVGVVLKTHKILMLNQPIKPDEKGYFRQQTVYVGNEVKRFISVSLLRDELYSLLKDMQNPALLPDDKDEYQALCRLHHVMFECIHPFIDGNGRVGRMLYNWERVHLGLPIEVIRELYREKYYEWFR